MVHPICAKFESLFRKFQGEIQWTSESLPNPYDLNHIEPEN